MMRLVHPQISVNKINTDVRYATSYFNVQDGDAGDGAFTTDRDEFSRAQKPPRKQVKR